MLFGLRGPQNGLVAPIRLDMTDQLSNSGDLAWAVVERRMSQDKRHGGPAHDDTHTLAEWVAMIKEHADASLGTRDFAVLRHEMLDVAALALAAIESAHRKARPGLVVLGKAFATNASPDGFFGMVTKAIVAELEKSGPTAEELAVWLEDPAEIEKRLAGTVLASLLEDRHQREAILGSLLGVASMLREDELAVVSKG